MTVVVKREEHGTSANSTTVLHTTQRFSWRCLLLCLGVRRPHAAAFAFAFENELALAASSAPRHRLATRYRLLLLLHLLLLQQLLLATELLASTRVVPYRRICQPQPTDSR